MPRGAQAGIRLALAPPSSWLEPDGAIELGNRGNYTVPVARFWYALLLAALASAACAGQPTGTVLPGGVSTSTPSTTPAPRLAATLSPGATPLATPVTAPGPTSGPSSPPTSTPVPIAALGSEPGETAASLSPAEVRGLTHLGVISALADLKSRLGEELNTVRALRAEEVIWRNSGLGCPEPDGLYLQVLTPGIKLLLSYQGREFDYRITGFHGLLCTQEETEAPLERRPLEGLWSTLARLPTARSEVAAAELNGKIYVLGGFGSGATANEEYDPATDTWRRRASIPSGVDHAAAASAGGKVYLMGGFDGRWGPVSDVWSYDPGSDSWSRLADLPTPRGALGAAVVAGEIYAIGGRGTAGDVGATERYDPATDSWEPRSSMPTPRDHIGVAAAGGKIYVAGGRLGTFARNLAATEEYDPASDTWVPKAPMPTPRSGIAAVESGGRVYVFGGESVEGAFDDSERYDPDGGAWLAMPPMPTARHGLAAVAVGDRIYVLAGGTQPGGSASGLNEVFIVLGNAGR